MKTTVKQSNERALFEAHRDELVLDHRSNPEDFYALKNLLEEADEAEARIDKIRRLAKKVAR